MLKTQKPYLSPYDALQSAIEYMMKNMQAAKEALSDMPPRTDDELDPVTLHSQGPVRAAFRYDSTIKNILIFRKALCEMLTGNTHTFFQ